jgi:dihydroorotate dehydrogenase
MDSLFYNINKTYEENYKTGPIGLAKLKKPIFKSPKPNFKFLGFPVNMPFGISAGPLFNSLFVKAASAFGFSVLTYKTARSKYLPCHPFPNILYIKTKGDLRLEKNRRVEVISKPGFKISITNSFGVPSQGPDIWQDDVKKALSYIKSGQLLIMAFMGTAKPNQSQQELIDDFALSAKMSKETKAKVLEVNLSCPNIGNEGLICYNLEVTEKICKAIRNAIGNTPLILKVGYYKNKKDLEKLGKIANEYGNAIAVINTIQSKILDKNGKQAIPGKNRLLSGVCGHAIKRAGLEMVSKLNKIRQKGNYKFEIVGIGGVLTSNDFFEYRKKGADLVQSATGAMWNPYLAYDIWKQENL